MPKLNWKRLLIMAGVALLLLLMLRGCLAACSGRGGEAPPPPAPTVLSRQSVDVYMYEEKRTARMDLEEYLAGVVAAEMPASFHVEALKAQAVAARTYTLSRIRTGGCAYGAEVCTRSDCCQAYSSQAACEKKWGADYAQNMEKIKTAVIETAGEAIYYEGALIEALYHAASGGHTEDSENVFSQSRPYLRGVSSENEVGSSHITDETRIPVDSFISAVNAAWPKAKLTAKKLSTQVAVEERFSSGRVKTVRLGGAVATGRELRGALELYSAWFSISISGDEVVIQTRGHGHGVGMSQTGANAMARAGTGYVDILKHYYSGVEVK